MQDDIVVVSDNFCGCANIVIYNSLKKYMKTKSLLAPYLNKLDSISQICATNYN